MLKNKNKIKVLIAVTMVVTFVATEYEHGISKSSNLKTLQYKILLIN